VADLYTLVLDFALTNPSNGHGREGYYFGASDEYKWYDLAKTVAEETSAIGHAMTAEPTPLSDAELMKYWGVSTALCLDNPECC
jgi:hypothetical protein